MKRTKRRLPIPQNEFGFAPNTFNLFGDYTSYGERISREREQAEKARQLAEAAQPALIQTER
jgi:ketopantoate hydroxymethyltransferase